MSRRNWGGMWPYMYFTQPGGWGEQTMGMGWGQRAAPFRQAAAVNDLFGPCSTSPSSSSCGTDPMTGIDALGALFGRLILQNQLTRLAGDLGGALWGTRNCGGGNGCNSSNSSSNNNNNNNMQCMCHTCPNATRPYMGSNNVFVIPAAHVQGGGGSLNLNANSNLNMFLSGLGLALGGGCGGGGGGNMPPGFSFPPVFGPGPGGQLNNPSGPPAFSCSRCNFQM